MKHSELDAIHSILKKYWAFDSFRPIQEDIIRSVLAGKDTLALLPTGGGKSVCFQVPALAMEGLCVVVSPLIALMKDQVENLEKKGIPARSISSSMPYSEVRSELRKAATGAYKFLYISPERIETQAFMEFLSSAHITLIAIDEAHCISQWGYDFRPAYLKIKKIRAVLPGVAVIALTASATPDVQQDICHQLQFSDHNIFRQSFERPNLAYRVEWPAAKQKRIPELLNQHDGSAIVYCKTRRQTQRIAELLIMHGISTDHYHAGLTNEQRSRKQEAWLKGSIRVMVCTNAFGMGIDKPDVRIVIHAESPDCLENYYQEAGRAGRDGKPSTAVLLTNETELRQLKEQSAIRFPEYSQLKTIYLALMDFLQVPAGFGEGNSFDIDLATFAANFKLDTLKAYYGIQALARCGLLFFNESFGTPSTVEFICRREDLTDVEKIHPELFPVVQGLLRSYEGVFDSETPIYESQLATFTGIPYGILVTQLGNLQRAGLINYKKQSEKPQILLLLNRMYNDDFRIDMAVLKALKQRYDSRLAKMLDYVNEKQTCRSELIAKYFGSSNSAPCNICDNCIENSKPVSEREISKLAQKILSQLSSTTPTPLAKIVFSVDRENMKRAILMLQEEQLIRSDGEGNLLKGN